MMLIFGFSMIDGYQIIQQIKLFTHHLMKFRNVKYQILLTGMLMTEIVVSLLQNFIMRTWKLWFESH